MRSFLKIVAGSMFGFFAAVLIGSLFLLALSGGGKKKHYKVEKGSVLQLDIPVVLPDRSMENPLASFNPLGLDMDMSMGLFELKRLIEHAGTDDRISGIYLRGDFLGESFASLDQLRRTLDEFKASGKFIIAYNNLSSQKTYLVSSVADEVYVHPSGYFEFDGLSIETMYFKKMLDKLDITPMPLYAGDFKSASEPYRRTDMSEENREQLRAILEDLYGNYLATISEARGVSREQLKRLADELAIIDPASALEYGLIDGLAYEDEVHDVIRERLGLDEDSKFKLVKAKDYKNSYEPETVKGVSDKIAVVYAEGSIVLGEGSEESIGGERFMKEVRKLRKDDQVKAIVLRVNSPGGVAFSSDKIWRELWLAKQEKPLVVSMGSNAASGGYYIASMADRIYAEKNTITGSIGVVGMLLNMEDFMSDKVGLTFDRERTGPYADFGNLTREWTEREWEVAQGQVRKIYEEFKQRVAEGRGMTLEAVEAVAQGRVWTGQDAVEIGLVDEIGDLDAAIAHAAELAELEEFKLREYPQQKDLFQRLFDEMTRTRADKLIRDQLGPYYEELDAIRAAREWSGIQMRMPFELKVD